MRLKQEALCPAGDEPDSTHRAAGRKRVLMPVMTAASSRATCRLGPVFAASP
jgi:hypothetical protein